MKLLKAIGLTVLILCLCVCCFAACDDKDQSDKIFENVSFENAVVHYNGEAHEIIVSGDLPEGTIVTYENNEAVEEGVYNATATLKKGDITKTLSATLTVKEPTAEQVVLARQNTVNQDKNYFDYRYKLEGQLQMLGIEGSVNGIYTGQYRENKATGDFGFKRTTEGALLLDSVKYVYGKGNQLVTLKMDSDGSVKKVYVETVDEQNETFVHKPIEQFVNGISKEEIENISVSSDIPGYKYKAMLKLTSKNVYVQNILKAVSNLGTTVSLKGVEIPNLANGIQLYFNYGKGGYIDEFFVSINITVPIKMAKASITLSYEQQGATDVLQIPQDSGFMIEDADINTAVQDFNNAMLSLKTSDAYSIDVAASNDFDPSWKIAATVDKYAARLYKNTVNSDIYFNHSYTYKAHHEDDGAETYKYTLGNVIGDDAGVYLVSRKGKNTVTLVDGTYTADTQFDYLSSMVIIDADNVDCI